LRKPMRANTLRGAAVAIPTPLEMLRIARDPSGSSGLGNP
jgi:hypothetical protein